MTTPILALLLTGCAPQDAEITGNWHVWLAANNSATVDEGELDLVERATRIYDCARGWDDETGTWEIGYIGPRSADETASDKYFGGACDPEDSGCDQAVLDEQCDLVSDLEFYTFLKDDGYYYLTEPIDTWRTEAIINGEGDFQLTLHNKLGNGQDMRLAFVVEPGFAPVECLDEDGDGTANVVYTDGEPWLAMWSDDEDAHNIYYLNAGSYQIEPTGSAGGAGSEAGEPEYWYFTSEWNAGFGISKFAAEEFVSRPTDYGNYDEVGDGPNFNLIEDIRNECAASRSTIPPLVDAGADRIMLPGETIELDGSGTTDPDGDELTYEWKISSPTDSGAAITTDGSSGSFTPVSPGNYKLSLEVFDGAWRVTDTLNVTVEDPNHVPYCDAVGDALVQLGDSLVMDATADDIDGDTLTYTWSYVDPDGMTVQEGDRFVWKDDKNNELASVTLLPEIDGPFYQHEWGSLGTGKFVYDYPAGVYTFIVTAEDPDGKSCTTSWDVNVEDGPSPDSRPLCYAGTDLEGTLGDTFDLDMADAVDVDGGTLTYEWSVAGGPADGEALVEPIGSGPTATFTPDASGAWTLRLTAYDDDDDSDGEALQCTSTVVVTVQNNPPLCDVVGNVQGILGETITLTDRTLDDPEGHATSASWSFEDGPDCVSSDVLTDNGDGTASLVYDLGGFYEATYTGSDGDKECERSVTVQTSCDEFYDGAYTCHVQDSDAFGREISHLAMQGVSIDSELEGDPGFSHKTESNTWRPIDDRDSGLDGWAEISSSWVRISEGSTLEVGGSASGDFQIMMQGFESSSWMVIEGSFNVDKIRKDAWAYPDLEEIKREESGEAYCGGDTVGD